MTFIPARPGVEDYLSKQLSQNGADVAFSANGDYSGGAVYWEARPDSDEVWRIGELIIDIVDLTGFGFTEYGNTAAALANGIDVYKVRGTGSGAENVFQLNPRTVTANGHWTQIVHNGGWVLTDGTYDRLNLMWRFTDGGVYVRLDGGASEALRVVLNDDLTGLSDQRFTARGYKEGKVS